MQETCKLKIQIDKPADLLLIKERQGLLNLQQAVHKVWYSITESSFNFVNRHIRRCY